MNNLRKVLLGAALAASVFNFGIYAAAHRANDKLHGVSFEYINEIILNDIALLEANLSTDGLVDPVVLVTQPAQVASVNQPAPIASTHQEIGFNVPTVGSQINKIEPYNNGYKLVLDTGRVIIVASSIALEALIASGLYTSDMTPIMSTLSKYLAVGAVASLGSAAVEAALPKSGEKRKRA